MLDGITDNSSFLSFFQFDESTYSQQRLSSMCTAAPWFFVTGYLTMFCAVFSQLWRLSKVLSIRRQKVKIAHVMKPFGIIICSSIIILSVWTAIDPFVWVRKITSGKTLVQSQLSYNIIHFFHSIQMECLLLLNI